MNMNTILSEWSNVEKSWASVMFDEKKVDTTIRFDSKSPELMRELIQEHLSKIYDSIDECIESLKKIREELS